MDWVTGTMGSPTLTPFQKPAALPSTPRTHTSVHSHLFLPRSQTSTALFPKQNQVGGGTRWGAKGPPRPPHASLLVLLAIPATLLRAPLSEEEREEGLRGGESARAGARARPRLRGGDEGVKDPGLALQSPSLGGEAAGGRTRRLAQDLPCPPRTAGDLGRPDAPAGTLPGQALTRAHKHSTPLPSLAPSPILLPPTLAPSNTHAPARCRPRSSSEPQLSATSAHLPRSACRAPRAQPTPSDAAGGGSVPWGGRARCPRPAAELEAAEEARVGALAREAAR